MTLVLKNYQVQSLDTLRAFLLACRSASPAAAFAAHGASTRQWSGSPAAPAYSARFGADVPCVCLRVPTGGGKTLMAAHAVAIAGQALLHSDTPVALWLTPSDTIRRQTLEAFSDARHPYRQALAQHFGDRVRVCDLDSLQTIGPHDVGHAAIVVISTIQALSVRKTADRTVYSFFEALSPHFAALSPGAQPALERVSLADLEHQPFLTSADVGRIKHSVANWLHMQHPLVIVDEAHNHQTAVFYKAIERLNPSCVLEFTATPVAGINVLHHVAAQELKAEQMVKLPIVLTEHPQGWQQCLHHARLTRDHLETLAAQEPDYLRPLVLVQAQDKNGAATVDVVRQFLQDEEGIDPAQIAVVTGTQKDLDGINLLDAQCPVRYVVTVEALKEGWDCAFAYVLAGLQDVHSAKDVEQLLGRVLRMPYARTRKHEALNKAYAHIVAESFAQAAHNITDRLVHNMGFNAYEAASMLASPQLNLALQGGQAQNPMRPDSYIPLPAMPTTQVQASWPPAVREVLELRPTSVGATALLAANVSDAAFAQVEQCLVAAAAPAQRPGLQAQFEVQRALRAAHCAPAQLGQQFAPLPQLCLPLDGHLEVVDRHTLAGMGQMRLDGPVQLAAFGAQTLETFEIDLEADGMKYHKGQAQQVELAYLTTAVLSEEDLVRWLDREVRQNDIGQLHMRAWLLRMLRHLQQDRGFSLAQLVTARFALVPCLTQEIERLRAALVEQSFSRRLPLMTLADVAQAPQCSFRFEPGIYPARNVYRNGSYGFSKHFYGAHQIHDLQEVTGAGVLTEEFVCARAIDMCPQVKHWVRNIERQEKSSFWLPTSTDYFYPDFVAELHDGRLLVVEYKGSILWDSTDSTEKRLVGQQWETESKGRCLFLMARKVDTQGRDVAGQIAAKVAG
jgi:type III restriction enzyme